MSKISNKQRYEQLMEWLTTIEKPAKEVPQTQDGMSRAEYYKSKGLQ